MADSYADRYWNLLLSGDHPLLQLTKAAQRRVLCFVTCELLKEGKRKNPAKMERDIVAFHFGGDADAPGAYIAKRLVERKGQGLTAAERVVGDAILMALRADRVAHVLQINKRAQS